MACVTIESGIACGTQKRVIEVTPDKRIAWEFGAADAPEALRRRQVDSRREVDVGDPAVVLHDFENLAIDGVKSVTHAHIMLL